MLGDRIRELRKQQKMTLEGLAGKELTKGMLSLIENNKANPSMESLTFIAKQLGVDVAELLGEDSSGERREVLEHAEVIYNTPKTELPEKYLKLLELIEPFIGKLAQGYESARLLEIYSYALQRENKHGWESTLKKAADMYDQMNISANRARIGIFLSDIPFFERQFEEALKTFQLERKAIEAKYPHIEPLTQLDLDYSEAILLYAAGHTSSAIETTERAIAFSKEKRIFYRIDDLYRLAAAHTQMEGNIKEGEYYLNKLKIYGEFADHSSSLYFYKLFSVMRLISDGKYTQALSQVEESLSDSEIQTFYKPWFYLEKAKVLYYLKRYEEALTFIEKVVMPEIYHPIDLSSYYIKETYHALILSKLGRTDEAISAAKTAVHNLAPLPDSKLKQFSFEVLENLTNEHR
ncbi:helix-turn-helix domain-containing protein [Sutcliffiella rhizosphaerae]|uniref:HTH cro/C1-type domain-containing protein n=1 Tax=Sutcliffiella rhizosphaerae TaxID=2880967 RepID=A0ABM8YK78_9BACI|nr:helix-turn-helix transcriptional regulator [Sutcliffiella rhizosphaerae]CAG9620335.1 hypothetical protein BACCIP111883_01103 [Sutcliffiella rhizosphaerae]